MKIHGMSNTPEWRAWKALFQRCYNPKTKNYNYYGGRGIKVCERWLESFKNFHEDMGIRPTNYSLDRIDNDKDYEPNNCKWSTKSEQNKNKRKCKWIHTDKGWRRDLI